MQRAFAFFPSGWPGGALLLLRIALAGAALADAGCFLVNTPDADWPVWSAALAIIAAALALCVGFLTPLAGILLAVAAVAALAGWLPLSLEPSFIARVAAAQSCVMGTVLAILGPGAYSIDARLFGRRRIVIPRMATPR